MWLALAWVPRKMNGWNIGQLSIVLRLNINWEYSLKTGYYIRGSCILMRWSDGLHLVVQYGYSLDIGNTVGLVPLWILMSRPVHNNVIPWPCAVQGHTQMGSLFVHALYVYWKLVAYQNVTREGSSLEELSWWLMERKRNLLHKVSGNPPLPVFSW